MSKPKKQGSTWQKVRNILSGAINDDSAYPARMRFWELPLEEFLTTEIYGVRLIAPEILPTDSVCCEASKSEKCSERSGLIKGLKGQVPFDGIHLPRLPAGGQPVSDENIQFIADWIDQGCPQSVGNEPIELTPLNLKETEFDCRTLGEVAEFEVLIEGINDFEFQRDGLKQRANLDCMTEKQLEQLRSAFRQMYDLNHSEKDRRSYNNQALIHQNHCQHGWERFLPWHRAYLYEFEQNMRDLVANVMLPYWDWTMLQYKPENPEKGWIIPQALQAFLSPESLPSLFKKLDPMPSPGQRKRLEQMAADRLHFVSPKVIFSYIRSTIGYRDITPQPENTNRQAFIDALLASNPLWYPLRFPAEYQKPDGSPGTINEVIHYHYPTADDIEQILAINNFRDFGGGSLYNDSFGFLDQNPHNTLHIWTGGMNPEFGKSSWDDKILAMPTPEDRNHPPGVLVAGRKFHKREDLYSQPKYGDMFSNLTASFDPIFWCIHVNVDRIWHTWQTRFPHAQPADLDAVLTPWSYTLRDTLDSARFGYEYVRGSFLMPVGLEATISRFCSKPIAIKPAMKTFKRAEIRLHRVPQLLRSGFIRAFINQPEANADTPIQNNPHYAGYLAIFGHGPCYGGPGHCDPPPASPRLYDQRPRDHNTPRNYRIDITETARSLLAGIDSLQITLVVIGADFQEDRELLKLEAVSLNFSD